MTSTLFPVLAMLSPRKAIAACDPHRKTTGTQNHTHVMADRNMTVRFMTGKRKARRSRACDAFRFLSGGVLVRIASL